MAGPITWHALMAPNLVGAANMMQGAQDSFNSAFGALRSSLTENQDMRKANVGKMTDYNTGLLLDKLASYKTPEELAAAQASGEIEAMKTGFGGQYDRNKMRGAEQTQLKTLQDQWRTQLGFDTDVRNQNELGIKDEHASLIAAGEFDKAAALRANNELLGEGDMALAERDMRQKVIQEARAAAAHNNQQTLFGQAQEDRRELKANEAQQKDINNWVAQNADQYGSEAEARPALIEYAKSKGYSGQNLAAGMAQFSKSYNDFYGFTQEQQDDLARASEGGAATLKQVQEEMAAQLAREKANRPYGRVFSALGVEPESLNEGKALEMIDKKLPGTTSDTRDSLKRGEINLLAAVNSGRKPAEFVTLAELKAKPYWGAIIAEAGRRAEVTGGDTFYDGRELAMTGPRSFESQLIDVYREAELEEANRADIEKMESDVRGSLRQLESGLMADVRAREEAHKAANKFRIKSRSTP